MKRLIFPLFLAAACAAQPLSAHEGHGQAVHGGTVAEAGQAQFEIVAEGVDDENFYIQQVDLNGKSVYYLSHDDLLKGGKLSFRMGNSPKY